MKPKDSARMVLTAINSFASQSPKYLKVVNFVIFQATMMKEFKQAVTSFTAKQSSSKMAALGQYIKGILTLKAPMTTIIVSFVFCRLL